MVGEKNIAIANIQQTRVTQSDGTIEETTSYFLMTPPQFARTKGGEIMNLNQINCIDALFMNVPNAI